MDACGLRSRINFRAISIRDDSSYRGKSSPFSPPPPLFDIHESCVCVCVCVEGCGIRRADIKNIFRRERTAIDFRFIRFTPSRPWSSIGPLFVPFRFLYFSAPTILFLDPLLYIASPRKSWSRPIRFKNGFVSVERKLGKIRAILIDPNTRIDSIPRGESTFHLSKLFLDSCQRLD